jgi:hypothetical protein
VSGDHDLHPRWLPWADIVLTLNPMAVWDLNSNLDVFSMQTFLRGLIYVRWAIQAKLADWFQKRRLLNNFPIGSYVKTMSAEGGHFQPRSGSLNTILKVDHLGWSLSGQFSKLCPVTLTSIQDDHLQRTYCSFNIGPYGKKCFTFFSEISKPI